MGLSGGERISLIRSAVLIQYTRVTDRRTDRQTELTWHIRAIAYNAVARKNIPIPSYTAYGSGLNDVELRLFGILRETANR